MRPEIICSVWYCTGIKYLSCKVMMMCWKYELLLILGLCSERGIGQVCTGCIPNADISNVTWWESMTHFTSGSFALCDKGSKNVNKFSVSANLAYYLRTATKKDLPCWQVFVSWQKRAQSTNTLWRREIQIWCQVKWHVKKCFSLF